MTNPGKRGYADHNHISCSHAAWTIFPEQISDDILPDLNWLSNPFSSKRIPEQIFSRFEVIMEP